MRKILLVEDEEMLRDAYTAILSTGPYTIDTAGNGQEALVKCRTDHFDLILLDLMMPYLDGRDELKLMAMSGGERSIPVIVVTAFLGAGNEEQALREGGVVHIVYKPFDLEKLVGLVKETIGEPGEADATEGKPA